MGKMTGMKGKESNCMNDYDYLECLKKEYDIIFSDKTHNLNSLKSKINEFFGLELFWTHDCELSKSDYSIDNLYDCGIISRKAITIHNQLRNVEVDKTTYYFYKSAYL